MRGDCAALSLRHRFHGGNHYGNWSLFAETDNNTDSPAAFTAYSTSVRGVGGPESESNTVRYANAAPLHSDGTRNEPRFSHLAALQNLVRAHAGVMLTTNGSVAPADDGPAGCIGLPGYAHNPVARIQCVVYGANTTDEITFAIGGNGGSVSPPLNASAPPVPTQMASIYGAHLGFPGDGNHQATVVVIAADRKTVLWNSSAPAMVDLGKHRIVPDPAVRQLRHHFGISQLHIPHPRRTPCSTKCTCLSDACLGLCAPIAARLPPSGTGAQDDELAGRRPHLVRQLRQL